jgi:hypothetical protein
VSNEGKASKDPAAYPVKEDAGPDASSLVLDVLAVLWVLVRLLGCAGSSASDSVDTRCEMHDAS